MHLQVAAVPFKGRPAQVAIGERGDNLCAGQEMAAECAALLDFA
jgi:hypothetical protein